MSDSIRVAVRVRPFIHAYEKVDGIKNVIRMDKATQQTVITNPENGSEKVFTFDFSYNSFVPEDHPDHANQETVWNDLGVDVLENAWKGFNVSLFAYGQTGAGKSHSMIGYPGAEGIVPRASREIFERIGKNQDRSTTFRVEASMIEIYNEKVRDLFNPEEGKNLKVRDHPKKGPYLDGLTRIAVGSYGEINQAMESGTRARTVAATAMNATSSRAHTIFQVVLTQTVVDEAAGNATDKTSTISLIDLAGSERADRTGASGDRLKEGSAINKSLSALGNVIFALAEKTNNPKKKIVVPYRDSVLTHLLKNSLGGNAKTIMIAAIAPSDVNYDETLSTLRYADRAKQIKNKAVVNEDPNQKLIRGLKEEIEQLRAMLASQAGGARPGTAQVLQARAEMSGNQRLLRASEQSWEQRLAESKNHLQQNNNVLAKLGMTTDESKVENTPYITNLNQDPQMNGVLTYFFEEGMTRVGRKDAQEQQNIILSGLSIQKEHAIVTHVKGKVILECCQGAKVYVNGTKVQDVEESDTDGIQLQHGDRIIFGNNHVFLFVLPNGVDKDGRKCPRSELLAKHTWESAMEELNRNAISSLTDDGERIAREKAELEAKEMQEKVAALERRIQEERLKAEQEARAATDAEREKMAEKQRELEAALQRQIESTNRQHAMKERERRKQAMLDAQILRTLPLLSEANAISEELAKGMRFSIQLVATQTAPTDNQETIVKDDASRGKPVNLGEVSEDFIASCLETSLWVKVETEGMEVPSMWDYDKFINRLYLMREMYEDFVDCDRDMKEIEDIYGDEYDPFFDPPQEQVIGKAYIMLAPLMYFINIDDSVPIIQYQGKTDGVLDVSISLDDEQVEAFESYDLEEEKTLADVIGEQLRVTVTTRNAKGLPKQLSHQVAVSYKIFTETRRTPANMEQSINPRFDDVAKFTFAVTQEFVRYIQNDPVEFQVWGCPQPRETKPGRGRPKESTDDLEDERLENDDEAAEEVYRSNEDKNRFLPTKSHAGGLSPVLEGKEHEEQTKEEDEVNDEGMEEGEQDGKDDEAKASDKSNGKKKKKKKHHNHGGKTKGEHVKRSKSPEPTPVTVPSVDTAELQALRERLAKQEEEKGGLSDQVKALLEQVECAKKELEQERAAKTSAEKEVQVLRKELGDKKDQLEELQAKAHVLGATTTNESPPKSAACILQ